MFCCCWLATLFGRFIETRNINTEQEAWRPKTRAHTEPRAEWRLFLLLLAARGSLREFHARHIGLN